MANLDVICEKIHFRHDLRWSERFIPADGGALVCLACVIEMMEMEDLSTVRKSVALAGLSRLLKSRPGISNDVLMEDKRVCLHFTASLLNILRPFCCYHHLRRFRSYFTSNTASNSLCNNHYPIDIAGTLLNGEDSAMLEQVSQVLLQLLQDLPREWLVQYVLDDIKSKLCEKGSVRGFLPCFIFLGKLLDMLPDLSHKFVSTHLVFLEHLVSGLLYPDEELKVSVCYVLSKLWSCAGAVQSLPAALRDRMCVILTHTLMHARSSHLTINCLGVLQQMLKLGEVVCVLMNGDGEMFLSRREAELNECKDTDWAHPSVERCSLPLLLKKLLLSGEETLQMASVHCMSTALVHSPSQYCEPFIKADIPEFLFERLGSSSEVMLWKVYGCLLLLTEDPHFFTQCHSVYGIESLVRSLKVVLKMTNMEVQRQGLLLLTVILERQPAGVRLFPAGPGFVGVAEVVVEGVASACLEVATQAAQAASALFRLNHQSSPVQFRELVKLVEAVTARCTELPFFSTSQHRVLGALLGAEAGGGSPRGGGFLLQALLCLQEACRSAEHWRLESRLYENAHTAPDKQEQHTLESLCVRLLHCCDTACIPCVTRMCARTPSPQMLQLFYSILCSQFSLSPSITPTFATKLASSGFLRMTMENKAQLCSGNRNVPLNQACCDFLQKLCMSLLSQLDLHNTQSQDMEEVGSFLLVCLPSVCCRVSEWPAVLHEGLGQQRATQHCLLLLTHLSLLHGDRLFPDAVVFGCVVSVVCSAQELGDPPIPAVLRAALHLLALTQDSSPDLDWVPLNCLSKALSSCPLLSSVLSHDASLLRFVFRYPELAEQFGECVLSPWLARGSHPEPPRPTGTGTERPAVSDRNRNPETAVLLDLMKKNSPMVLTVLAMACSGEVSVSGGAVRVLGGFLQDGGVCDAVLASLIKPALLQLLQRLTCESPAAHRVTPVVLRLLCMVRSHMAAQAEMDSTDFKLLFHVSNLAGKMNPDDADCLLPALNYIYCCINMYPKHCTDRAVSMLLCNVGLMEQLESTVSLSPLPKPSLSPPTPSSALLGCSCLLLSSLISLQHAQPTQVHKRVTLNLDSMVRLVAYKKRKTDSLLLACVLRLLQAVLAVDLSSELLCIVDASGAWQRPLQVEDSALYPLGLQGSHCLTTALFGLMLQRQELLLGVAVNCFRSLIGFLRRRHPATAQHVLSQPWSRLLLYALLNSGENQILHQATLSLLTLLVRGGSQSVQWEAGMVSVLAAAERRGVGMLGKSSAQALCQLLAECSVTLPAPTEELRVRAQGLLDSLNSLPASEEPTNSVLCFEEMYICRGDFSASAEGF